jgi:glycosyltransferase involved in cell wall biosynthesis
MSAPRICLLVESYAPVVGGMERQARLLVTGLVSRAVRTTVVTLRSRPELPAVEQRDGVEVHRVGRGRSRWRGLLPVARRLLRLREEYDVVLVDGFRTMGLAAIVAARRCRKRVVLRAANNGEFSGAFFDPGLRMLGLSHESWLMRPLNALRQAVLRRADRFIVPARSLRDELVAGRVPAERVSVIPNGVDLTRFRPAQPGEAAALRSRLGLPPDVFTICFSGRLVRWKGPLVLLEAWRSLVTEAVAAGEWPARSYLVFLGAGGQDLASCEDDARGFVARHRRENTVRFAGDVINVEEYLRAADGFALPTEGDIFAIAVLEAMASGLPVVTTRVAGLADYVVAGENALVVEPGDVRGVRDALTALAADPILRERLGRGGVRTAARYSPDAVVDEHLQLLAQVTQPASGHAQRPMALAGTSRSDEVR